jgi:hypothetical protein
VKDGNWIPIDKGLLKFLPRDREYSMIEAAYSLQVDFDSNRLASVSGYSKLWAWSRKKVRTFLKNMGVEIQYPDGKMSPKGGQVGLQVGDKQGTSRGQVRLINSKYLGDEEDKQGTSRGQVGDKQGNTTKDPKPKPDPKPKKVRELPPTVLEFSGAFYEYLSKNGGKQNYSEKEITSGAETIDKLIRLDGYDLDAEIKPALQWGLKDAFWSGQIRSLAQLRKKSKKNSDTKFTNLFNQFSARTVKPKNNGTGRRTTFEEFEEMIGGLSEQSCDIGNTQTADSIGAGGPLGLPLPK